MKEYFIIATISSICTTIINIYTDFRLIEEYNLEGFTLDMFLNDICEGLILGLSWVISLPLLCIKNIILNIIYLIVNIRNRKEKENG